MDPYRASDRSRSSRRDLVCFSCFLWGLCVIGAVILAAFVILFLLEMHQDNDPVPYYEKHLAQTIPYDPHTQSAVIHASICTGEKTAGFKNRADGHFTEVMLIPVMIFYFFCYTD